MPYIGNELATQFQAFVTQTITGDGSTGYTLDRAVANGKELLVYINNVKQEEGSGKSYTASGTTITFSDAVASTDSCYVVFLGSAVQTVNAPDSSIVSGQIANATLVLPNKLDMNGNELILDADADSSITSDTDDQIDIKIAGADDFQFTANTFTALSGSTIAAQALTAAGDVSFDGGNFVFNESSADKDFRVESNGNANMLVVDGGNDVMSIGRAINTASTVSIQNKDDANNNTLDLFNDNGNRTISMQQDTTGNAKLILQKNDGTNAVRLDANLGGILFGTDTAQANTLDDYEEGSWTPTATDSSVTLATASGEYTKVGRMVHVTAIITFPTTSDGDSAAIGGFPFTCQNGNQYRGGFTIGYNNKGDNEFTFLMSGNTTEAVFHNLSGGSQAYSAHSGKLYIFSGHYPTAS